MTDLVKTPAGWPSILLARAAAKDPTDLDAAIEAGAFDGLRKAVHGVTTFEEVVRVTREN